MLPPFCSVLQQAGVSEKKRYGFGQIWFASQSGKPKETNINKCLDATISGRQLIKIKVSGAATITDQPRINRDPNGVNRGRVLSYATLFCAENRQNIATYI